MILKNLTFKKLKKILKFKNLFLFLFILKNEI